MDPDAPGGVLIPSLARFSPVLTPYSRASAYLELIRWWAALEVLAEGRAEGLTRLRRDAQRDVRLGRLLHTLTQARLAAAGGSVGATPTLEPQALRGRGDVLLEHGPIAVLIEVLTVSPDEEFQQQNAGTEQCLTHLHWLERDYDVHWEGDVPGRLPPHELSRWKEATTEAAAEAARRQQPARVAVLDVGVLSARPGPAAPGTSLTGPLVESDQGHRFLGKLHQKAEQTRDGVPAWIWVEDHGLFQPLTPFQGFPLEQKVTAFAGLVGNVLRQYPHLAGVVLSNAARRIRPRPPDHTVGTSDGFGFRRGLPGDRQRETIVVPRRLVLPDQTRLVARLLSEEPRWLDWALIRLGVPGGVRALIRDPS